MSDETTAVTDVTKPPLVAAAACLVLIYVRDGQPGRCLKLEDIPVRIGRDSDNDVELDDPGVSRRHARVERIDGRLVVRDVGSTNGTLLNGVELQGTAELRNGDRIKIGSAIFKYLSSTDLEASLHEQIYEMNIVDQLTQFHNRRHFDDVLAREVSRARRHSRPLSLLLLDIDHFKRVNDTHGHHVGDIALKATADAIRSRLRTEDTVARVGGEEIAVLLPETPLTEAVAVAEKIREAVASNPISFRSQSFHVTVSIGCGQLDPADSHAAVFVERCDRMTYEAKRSGRNCVRW